MTHTKEFRRENGDRYFITVKLHIDEIRQKYQYQFSVRRKGYRKRNVEYANADTVTEAEVREVAMELWNTMRPKEIHELSFNSHYKLKPLEQRRVITNAEAI
jgi:hypothetical protein